MSLLLPTLIIGAGSVAIWRTLQKPISLPITEKYRSEIADDTEYKEDPPQLQLRKVQQAAPTGNVLQRKQSMVVDHVEIEPNDEGGSDKLQSGALLADSNVMRLARNDRSLLYAIKQENELMKRTLFELERELKQRTRIGIIISMTASCLYAYYNYRSMYVDEKRLEYEYVKLQLQMKDVEQHANIAAPLPPVSSLASLIPPFVQKRIDKFIPKE